VVEQTDAARKPNFLFVAARGRDVALVQRQQDLGREVWAAIAALGELVRERSPWFAMFALLLVGMSEGWNPHRERAADHGRPG
jgi:hypothetical protein